MSIQSQKCKNSEANCTVCGVLFTKKTVNAKMCSSSCRTKNRKHRKRQWHELHKQSENAKARKRSRSYSKDQRKAINRSFRVNNQLSVLSHKICIICSSQFLQKSHNAKTCSIECRAKLKKILTNRAISRRLRNDLNFKLAHCIRNRVGKSLNSALQKESYQLSVIESLGCSIEYLVVYLEDQFQSGMSWNNWGLYGWHIDHIVPLSSFNLLNPEQFKKACHYTNLQPLWAKDNLKKGSKITP